MNVTTDRWAQDHLQTFVEAARAAEADMPIHRGSIRCVKHLHPGLYVGVESTRNTIMSDGEQEPLHDGWSCLFDLEQAGFLELTEDVEEGTRTTGYINMSATLTVNGKIAWAQVLRIKGEHGQLAYPTLLMPWPEEIVAEIYGVWEEEGIIKRRPTEEEPVPEMSLDPLD